LLALLAALLTATTLLTALLATLASGHLLLLAGLLLAALLTTLLTGLLAALLLAALLLAALLAHFVVGHGEFSCAEGFRGTTTFLRPPWFRERQMQLAGMPEQRCKAAVSPNYRHVGVPACSAPAKWTTGNNDQA
jgi:hypothetical protein